MKSVKDKQALSALALATGGKVVGDDGKRFNEGRVKADRPAKPKPDPLPRDPLPAKPAKPEPPREDPAVRALAESVDNSARAYLMMMAELKTEVAQMRHAAGVEQVVITSWDFTFARDEKGYLSGVHAQAFSYGEPLDKKTMN